MTDAAVKAPPIWKLRADHYLNVPNTHFIQRTQDGETGEQVEHRYAVPRLLQLDDPMAQTPRKSGQILVSTDEAAKLHLPSIWVFAGEPTPDMEPQNAAAQAISDALQSKWLKPFEELKANGGTGDFAKDLENALARVLDAASAGKSTSVGGVGKDMLAELQSQMQQLMNQNAEMAARLAAMEAPAAAVASGRRA